MHDGTSVRCIRKERPRSTGVCIKNNFNTTSGPSKRLRLGGFDGLAGGRDCVAVWRSRLESGRVNDPSNYLKSQIGKGINIGTPRRQPPPTFTYTTLSLPYLRPFHSFSCNHAITPVSLLFHSRRRLRESLCCKRGTCFI